MNTLAKASASRGDKGIHAERLEPKPAEKRQTADTSTPKLAVVFSRAYRSLVEFLEGGLALRGISLTDFLILEAVLHKGPLPTSVIASKVQLPNTVAGRVMDRLNRRGHIKRQMKRGGATRGVFELTEEGRKSITTLYEAHEKDIETVMGILSRQERNQLWQALRKIGFQGEKCQHARSRDRRSGLAAWQLRRVTEYMTKRVADTVRLEELAAQTGKSPSQFGRAFKLSVGISPHRWQMSLRIQEAQELLRGGQLPLAEISIATGFAAQSHFSRVFKEIVGVSPGAWQRQHRP